MSQIRGQDQREEMYGPLTIYRTRHQPYGEDYVHHTFLDCPAEEDILPDHRIWNDDDTDRLCYLCEGKDSANWIAIRMAHSMRP